MDDGYGPSTYGDRIADAYDERYLSRFADDTDRAVSFLKQLAGDGPALELGVGTGRIAIPLSQAGVEVHGIDMSEAMVSKMRSKPGGEAIHVTIGNFGDFDLPTRFRAIYVVFNTFFGLLTQDEQISCFGAIARHLSEDGVFVMQAFVPDVTRFDVHNQRISVEAVGTDEVSIETSTHDPFEQRTDSAYVVLGGRGVQFYPVKLRYAYVSELDLMARIAGLAVRERWAGWQREPYPGATWMHVTVWERAR